MKYLQQMFSYGQTRVSKESSAKSEGLKGLLFYIPMLFSLYIIMLFIPVPSFLNSFLLIPLIVYLALAMSASSLAAYKTEKGWYFIAMTIMFFITHLTYGLGMLDGWLNKCIKI